MGHSVEQLYKKTSVLQEKALSLHRERYKVQGTYNESDCNILLADIRALALDVHAGLVDFNIDFGKGQDPG